MSTRRLVQRSRQHDESSPAPRSHQRESQAGPRQRGAAPRQLTPLPPYEPPSCPLTTTARNELDQLRLNHDYTKYQMHLKTGKVNLTNATADAHDRLRLRRQLVEKEANKRRKDGGVEKTEAELEAEQRADALEAKVVHLTEKAEKAMREMIDYGDELAMNDTIMKDISENIPPVPASQPVRRRQRLGDDDDDENEGPEEEVWEEVPDVPGVSTIDLLNQAKEDYAANYTSKSMRAR
jgi:E3 SUMO-protein ligase NSE2